MNVRTMVNPGATDMRVHRDRGYGPHANVATIAFAFAVLVACSGSDVSGIKSAGDASSGALDSSRGPSSGSGSSGVASSGSADAAGSPDGMGSSSSGSPGSSSGADGSASGSGSSDASTPSSGAAGDAGRPTDSGSARIVCGRTACDPATDVCCITGARNAASCTTASACTGGQALTCSGTESCAAGEVCCGLAQTGGSLKTSCAATCAPGDVQICSNAADCSSGGCHGKGAGYGTCAQPLTGDAAQD
jgi:hypothetical protein